MPLIKAKLCETARNRFAATFAIYIYIFTWYIMPEIILCDAKK